MAYMDLSTLKAGDTLAPLSLKPISRTTLALFAGASGDHNPIHIDIDVAKKAGMDDVFCQGMLGMAYMSRMLTDIAPPEKIKSFGTKFANITQIYAQLTCTGQVEEVEQTEDGALLKLSLMVVDENDNVKLQGHATLAL
ncbi:MAG: hypothetical protein JKY45_01235 [Emcibacter sp.]|nr:hypothetical protein [Emcibacter sp.]